MDDMKMTDRLRVVLSGSSFQVLHFQVVHFS